VTVSAQETHDETYGTLAAPGDAAGDYARNGYVVLRGVVAPAACQRAVSAFRSEVKVSPDFLAERAREAAATGGTVFTESGFLRAPLSDFHLQPPGRFPAFHDAALVVLADADLHASVRLVLGEPGVVVESLYYEGNPHTWAHQDGWYFDSDPPGRLLGCWIALETIHPGAGRFFVYPGSHRLDMRSYGVPFDVSGDKEPYERLVLDVVRREGLACLAPALEAGDVLFWNGRTIHGTLETSEAGVSRSSLNLHLVPASGGLRRFGRPVPVEPHDVRGVPVHRPLEIDERVRNLARALLPKGARGATET
jgi:phytanoyl-CoA hydroxylase